MQKELNSHVDMDTTARMYSCEQCTYTTKRKAALYQHSLKHKNPRDHKSTTRGMKFKKKHNLVGHEKLIHRQLRNDENKTLITKPKLNSNGMFFCDQCSFEIIRVTSFRLHQKEHERICTFECAICGEKFRRKISLKRHIKNVHMQSENDEQCNNGNKPRMYSCDQCTYQTKWKSDLNKHKVVHENIRNFQCTVCGQMFKQKRNLQVHERLVHMQSENDDECDNDDKPRMYSCDQCTYQTKWKSYLNKHKMVHENIRNFQCTVCGKMFKRKGNLQVHERRVHMLSENDDDCNNDNKPRMYSCDQCTYQTKWKFDLNKHKLVHKNIRNFQCTVCGIMFKQKGNLQRHERRVHMQSENDDECDNDNKPRMYFCDQCTYQTKWKSDLNQHKVVHENICNFQCTVCGKMFKRKGNLQRHERLIH